MLRNLANCWRDEQGMVISAELVIVLTVVVIGLVVGLAQIQAAVVTELQGTAAALSSFNQSFAFTGFRGCPKTAFRTSWTAGSFFFDTFATCVGTGGPTGIVCDIFAGTTSVGSGASTVVTPEAACPTCIPDGQPVEGPCVTCPPAAGTLSPAPKPEIPLGPVPQSLPQQ